jgi:hypothetical protein
MDRGSDAYLYVRDDITVFHIYCNDMATLFASSHLDPPNGHHTPVSSATQHIVLYRRSGMMSGAPVPSFSVGITAPICATEESPHGKGSRSAIGYAALTPYNTLQIPFLFVRNRHSVVTLFRECIRHVGSLGLVTTGPDERSWGDRVSMTCRFPVNKSRGQTGQALGQAEAAHS